MTEEKRDLRDEARLYMAQGLAFQEQGRDDLAHRMFVEGVTRVEAAMEQGEVLYCIEGGVQMFLVRGDGSVGAIFPPSPLLVRRGGRREAWLQVGEWCRPIRRGDVTEIAHGAVLFHSDQDATVGLILPPSMDGGERDRFLLLLEQLTSTEQDEKSETATLAETISRGMVKGAESISTCLEQQAHAGSRLLRKGASLALQGEGATAPRNLNPRLMQGLHVTRCASDMALRATGCLVEKLGSLTGSLGRKVAPHVPEMGGFKDVAAGGVQGFATIYTGIENAARTLASSIGSETVNIISHKYGPEVGEVVDNAIFSIGNLALTAHNVNSLGIKSIAKRTAKEAGKAMLEEQKPSSVKSTLSKGK